MRLCGLQENYFHWLLLWWKMMPRVSFGCWFDSRTCTTLNKMHTEPGRWRQKSPKKYWIWDSRDSEGKKGRLNSLKCPPIFNCFFVRRCPELKTIYIVLPEYFEGVPLVIVSRLFLKVRTRCVDSQIAARRFSLIFVSLPAQEAQCALRIGQCRL